MDLRFSYALLLLFTNLISSDLLFSAKKAQKKCPDILKNIEAIDDVTLIEMLPREFLEEASEIRSIEEMLEKFPVENELAILPNSLLGSGNYLYIYKGTVEDVENPGASLDVFIKVPEVRALNEDFDFNGGDRSKEALFVNEIYWTKYLSDQGWGVQFHGLKSVKDSRLAIVTGFLEGAYGLERGTKSVSSLNFNQRLAARKRIFQMKKWFQENEIYAVDLQIRFDKEGVPFIVDPEYFRPMNPSQKRAELKKNEELFDGYVNRIPLQ